MKHEEEIIYNFILDNELMSQEALEVGTAVGGYNTDTLNFLIYHSTAYHDIEQLWACEKDNFYFSDEVKEFYGLEESEEE